MSDKQIELPLPKRGRGRPSTGVKMNRLSFNLRLDQIELLGQENNASGLLRDLIDAHYGLTPAEAETPQETPVEQ